MTRYSFPTKVEMVQVIFALGSINKLIIKFYTKETEEPTIKDLKILSTVPVDLETKSNLRKF